MARVATREVQRHERTTSERKRKATRKDRLQATTYLGISFPVYWIGLLLIVLFAVTLRWLPASGYGGIEFLILPALALGSRSIAYLARVTRSSMLEAVSEGIGPQDGRLGRRCGRCRMVVPRKSRREWRGGRRWTYARQSA